MNLTLSEVMPKSSKPKPATQPKPSKPVLSSTAKAAQHKHVMEYKNAKASTIALSVNIMIFDIILAHLHRYN
ncbi:hypothetical protein RSAG8_06157, partial [Rhizoctonia solani AG-8 WAC10335]